MWSLTLSPAAASGSYNTCIRSLDCFDVCVLTSGKGRFPIVQRSRNARTALLYRAPAAFATLLALEVTTAARKAASAPFGFRFNAASDIDWTASAPWLIPLVVSLGGSAYDYSKARGRASIPGYRIVQSVDSRPLDVGAILERGENVAVVLPIGKAEPMPDTWHGFPLIDGDVSDARCDDPAGVIVGLRAKGKIRASRQHPLIRAYVA